MSAPLAVRPLPPRPSLEYEKKEAKALLRRLRAGDPEALGRARARHDPLAVRTPADFRLADAQLVVAREYGFSSWPRLVSYFEHLERQQHSRWRMMEGAPPRMLEGSVRQLLAAHRARRGWAARNLASYVPRFYAMPVEDVLASHVTEDEARLAVARSHGCPSWEVLLEHAAAGRGHRHDPWGRDPMSRAVAAMAAADLDALRRVTDAHSELLHPSEQEVLQGRSLLRFALGQEERRGAEAMRPIVEWLVSQGFDLGLTLGLELCGDPGTDARRVRRLLDRGADPNFVAPNGIPALEHAILRYRNAEALDLLAAHATSRRALWIAAGLGDVVGVRGSLDRDGRPLPEAVRLRPPFDLVGFFPVPTHPEPGDEELLMEAFHVAMWSGRTEVLECLASRGFDVDSLVWEWPPIRLAVGNAMTSVVECLVRLGADLDRRIPAEPHTAREIAWGMFAEGGAHNPARRRVVELCGMDPDAILADISARPAPPPQRSPDLDMALALARDDANWQLQGEVRPENLLFGLLRGGGLPVTFFVRVSGMDHERFRADFGDRLRPAEEHIAGRSLPLSAEAQAAMDAAVAFATERRRQVVTGANLLHALTHSGQGVAAELLARYGGNAGAIDAELERHL